MIYRVCISLLKHLSLILNLVTSFMTFNVCVDSLEKLVLQCINDSLSNPCSTFSVKW